MACNECNNPYTGCTICNSSSHCSCSCPSTSDSCDCPTKDVSTDCSVYTGDDLVNSGIPQNTILTVVLEDLDAFIQNKFEEAIQYLTLINIGTGAQVFRGITGIGNKEIRTISAGSDIVVTEASEEIVISNLPSTETQRGVAEIATQVETDAGIDDEKIVTPAKLIAGITTIVSDSSNLPNATEAQRGVAEIATQAEVNAGTDDERFITPAKLQQGVETVVQGSTVIEQFIEGEVVDTVQNNTDLQNFITNITETVSSDPANLPNSTETQRGVIELATQAEVDAGTDTERAVTPATLSATTQTSIPIGLISMWSGDPNALPSRWSICDGTLGTPDLRGRFVVGFDLSNPDYNTIGNTGGLDEVVLTEAQMPIHNHTVNAFRADNQSVNDGNGSVVADQQANATIGDAGGDQPHENRPPYYTLAYIMYTG